MVCVNSLSAVPSLTLNVKLVYGAPLAFAAGAYLRIARSSWDFVTVAFALTKVPESVSEPSAGGVTTFTLASMSPTSMSVKPKSAAEKV